MFFCGGGGIIGLLSFCLIAFSPSSSYIISRKSQFFNAFINYSGISAVFGRIKNFLSSSKSLLKLSPFFKSSIFTVI